MPDETVEEAEEFLANAEKEWKKKAPAFLEFAGEWGGRRNRAATEDSLEYQYELYL